MAAITDLATLTAIAGGDWLVVNDISAGSDKKITQANLLGGSGTWTPSLTFGGAATGITYTVQSGNYTRAGTIVFVECRIVLSSKGSSTGNALLEGLPFSAAGNATPVSIFVTGLGSTVISTSGIIQGSNVILYCATGAYTSLSFATDAIFGNTTNVLIGGCYRTS